MLTDQAFHVLLSLLGIATVLAAGAAWRARCADRYRLAGRVVLVTGGSRGLGLVLARQLLGHGARVAICGRDREALARAEADLRHHGSEVLALPCDVRDEGQVGELVRQVEAAWGPIDVLINNAGVIEVGPAELMTPQDHADAMRTNYWGTVHTCLAVLPSMRLRRQGRIVNISSIGGKAPVPHLLPYCASKFAVTGFTETLRAEMAKEGVTVTLVCPGLTRTGSPRNADFKGRHRAEYTWFTIAASLPLLSMSAERTARQTITAMRCGDAVAVLTVAAKALALVHGLMPGLTVDVLALVNRLLPGPGGVGSESRPGRESQTALAPSLLTRLSDRAAVRNNEVAPHEPAAR